MRTITVHTDGAARGNPGPAAAGVVIREGNTILAEISEYLGEQTNNWAEYEALIRALRTVRGLLGEESASVAVHMDSELIVKQLKGEYRVKEPALREQYARVQELLLGMDVSFTHVRREFNKDADALCNQALDSL